MEPTTQSLRQEGGDEANTHGGIEYENEEFKDGKYKVREHGDLAYDHDGLHKLQELGRMVNKDRYETQEPPQQAYKPVHELGYGDD